MMSICNNWMCSKPVYQFTVIICKPNTKTMLNKNNKLSFSQCSKFLGTTSSTAPISASVIQGSALGPACFLVCVSDLHPVTGGNFLFKYADDVYLIIPSANSFSCATEIDNVSKWAQAKNLKLNHTKSQEMIISNKRVKVGQVTPPQLSSTQLELNP